MLADNFKLNTISESRAGWIDIARGIGMFLIALGHTLEGGLFRIWIYSFHVPLLFFLSDYTRAFSEETQAIYKKRIKSTLVLYFTFGILCYVYWAIFERSFRKDASVPLLKPLIGLFFGSGSDNLIFNAAIWFLPCLFSVFLIFTFILRMTKIKNVVSVLFSIALGRVLSSYLNFRLPWGVTLLL